MITNFDGLISKVTECSKKIVAVACAQDDAVLEAVAAAKERGIADAILVGDEAKIREIMLVIPNIIDPTVPIGKDDSENVEV